MKTRDYLKLFLAFRKFSKVARPVGKWLKANRVFSRISDMFRRRKVE